MTIFSDFIELIICLLGQKINMSKVILNRSFSPSHLETISLNKVE